MSDYELRIIAEIGVNHNGDCKVAKSLIDEAKKAGATAVKFQTFDVDSIIVPSAPKATYHIETTGDDKTGSWFDLLKSQSLTKDEFYDLSRYCSDSNIEFISTPYDLISAKILRDIGCKTVKIASTDANNFLLLRAVAEFAEEIILSTGMCDIFEVYCAVRELRAISDAKLTLMHCTSNYPVPVDEANIAVVETYRNLFKDIEIGFSDHLVSDVGAVCALALGATSFEKHITLSKKMEGPDHRSSLEPEQFKQYCEALRTAQDALGDGVKRVMPCEMENKQKLQKYIVANYDLKAGEEINSVTCGLKRNGGIGLPASAWDEVVGSVLAEEVSKGQEITRRSIRN
jgi:N,N'-diacetyllegionaminate synthase